MIAYLNVSTEFPMSIQRRNKVCVCYNYGKTAQLTEAYI